MVRLLDAEFVCTRLFDVADSITLEGCRAVVEKGSAGVRRLKLRREGSEFIQLSDPPLLVELGTRQLELKRGTHDCRVEATLYSHGAISVSLRVPVPKGATLEELIPLADELYDSTPLELIAKDELEKLRKPLLATFEAPHTWDQFEAYTVLFARELEAPGEGTHAEQVLATPGLARLLLGETNEPQLSNEERAEVLRQHFSYTPNDLTVIEWNAAFVYEPSGSEDVVELLEIANAQLLELRYYDSVLDAELQRMYEVVGQQRGSGLLFSPWKKRVREQMQTLIELSEFIERVENALKIVGDVYLARVYEAGLQQLRVGRWTEQVSRKHRLLTQSYGLLKGEVDTGRALWLETSVVLLIMFEIAMALLRIGH